MQYDETPTDKQIERALARGDAPPIRREWNTAGEWRRLHKRIAADDVVITDDVPRVRPIATRWKRWLSAAAVVIAIAGGVWKARDGAGSTLAVSTGRGERRSLQLEDGTRVALGPSSSVRVMLSRRVRRVERRRERRASSVRGVLERSPGTRRTASACAPRERLDRGRELRDVLPALVRIFGQALRDDGDEGRIESGA